jgi:hypothetical protein
MRLSTILPPARNEPREGGKRVLNLRRAGRSRSQLKVQRQFRFPVPYPGHVRRIISVGHWGGRGPRHISPLSRGPGNRRPLCARRRESAHLWAALFKPETPIPTGDLRPRVRWGD